LPAYPRKREYIHMDERRGDRFGRYEILSELGRGAVGIVYKARDPKINRVVAIKTFSLAGQSLEDEQDFRDRFVREAEAAGRLSHPGIVTIFDVGEEPETRAPYIVMECVGGQSLDRVLAANDNRLPLETALQLTHELAEALDCAHGQGVVHRDLKPANILITEDGHAKIADFGVAKLNLANQTLAGRALGTPAYMSPEQLNGEAVDGRSDLFSLGVVLYTVLTGYRPFQGNSAMTVSFKVVNRDPVPATVLDTDLPPALDYIIGRAMAKDPSQRYQRGMEMALDIQELQAGREPWTRAKEAGGSAVISQSGVEKAKPSMPVRPPMQVNRQPASARHGRGLGAKLLDELHRKSFAAALLVIGLAAFALRLAPFAHNRKKPTANAQVESRIAGPLAVASLPVQKPAETKPEDVQPAPAPLALAETASSSKPKKARSEPPLEASESVKITRRNVPSSIDVARANVPSANVPRANALANTNGAPAKVSLPNAQATTLDIEIEHNFAEANLSIWVDSRLSYTRTLEGTEKKKLVVFHRVEGHEFHAMQVPTGNHQIKVQVTSPTDSADHTGTIAGQFLSGKEKMLRIHFDKHGEMNLSLE
jgi:eukaryotic-like serine/threonine-protein kinase